MHRSSPQGGTELDPDGSCPTPLAIIQRLSRREFLVPPSSQFSLAYGSEPHPSGFSALGLDLLDSISFLLLSHPQPAMKRS